MTRALVLAAVLSLLAVPALAQNLTLDLGGEGSLAGRSIQLLLLVTVLGLVPGLAVTITCFPFIVTVLSILRQAIGLQQSPPNMLIVSLALFLTWFVMDPVFTEAWVRGLEPLSNGTMDVQQAIPAALAPFRAFMAARLDPETFAALQALRPGPATPIGEAPLSVMVWATWLYVGSVPAVNAVSSDPRRARYLLPMCASLAGAGVGVLYWLLHTSTIRDVAIGYLLCALLQGGVPFVVAYKEFGTLTSRDLGRWFVALAVGVGGAAVVATESSFSSPFIAVAIVACVCLLVAPDVRSLARAALDRSPGAA